MCVCVCVDYCLQYCFILFKYGGVVEEGVHETVKKLAERYKRDPIKVVWIDATQQVPIHTKAHKRTAYTSTHNTSRQTVCGHVISPSLSLPLAWPLGATAPPRKCATSSSPTDQKGGNLR